MFKIVYVGSEKHIDESEPVKKFRDRYIKGFDDEDLFLEALNDVQRAGYYAGVNAAMQLLLPPLT